MNWAKSWYTNSIQEKSVIFLYAYTWKLDLKKITSIYNGIPNFNYLEMNLLKDV